MNQLTNESLLTSMDIQLVLMVQISGAHQLSLVDYPKVFSSSKLDPESHDGTYGRRLHAFPIGFFRSPETGELVMGATSTTNLQR